MSNYIEELQKEVAVLAAELEQLQAKGTKASALRARKSTLRLAELGKKFRKLSVQDY